MPAASTPTTVKSTTLDRPLAVPAAAEADPVLPPPKVWVPIEGKEATDGSERPGTLPLRDPTRERTFDFSSFDPRAAR